MKKNLLLLFTAMSLIAPLMMSCGTNKPDIDGNVENGGNGGHNEVTEETLFAKYSEAITVKKALEIGNGLDRNEDSPKQYTLIGKVASEPNPTYGSFDLEQGGDKIICWNKKEKWAALDSKPVIGDLVVVKGIIKHYYDENKKKDKIEIYFPDILEVVLKGGSNGNIVNGKPATLTVTKSGNGTIKPSKNTGKSGEKVTFEVTMENNVYLRLTNNGKRVGKENGKYTLVLVPGENKINAEFVTYVPGEGHPELFESAEAQHWGDRGDSSVSLEEYYEPVRGLKGEALKNGLHELIQPKKKFTYDDLRDSFKYTEIDPDSPSNMVLMYTGELYPVDSFNGFGSEAGKLNREHVWPNSRGVGTSGPGSDKHMQRVCEAQINGRRSHYDFGYVSNGQDLSFLRDVNKGNILGNQRFEPKDAFKGDTARIIFYMATCYSQLELARPTDTSRYNYWTASNYHGDFEDLYEWATDPSIDPVSKFEMNRNNVVDTDYQHNRNPFIDHPEFIEMIYDKEYKGNGALND